MRKMRKNGQLSRYMWYTSTSLKLVGLWPSSQDRYGTKSNLKEKLNFLYFFVVASGMILQTCQMLTNCWINYTNFESAAESIGPMMALVTSFGKMCIYRYHRGRLANLVISLKKCLREGPSGVVNNLVAYAQTGSFACGTLLGVSWILTVGYLSAPLIEGEKNLPFVSWYPFDYKNSTILYALAYSHEVILTCLGCCTMSTEITFVWFICHCCARLKDLCEKLINLNKDNNEDMTNNVELKLSSLVKIHSDILREIEEINRVYTYIVIVLFLAAVIAICCAGLQVTSDSETSTSWTILFLVLATYYAEQLLFYYLPGEILAGESMAIAFAAYASGWESFGIKDRRIINLLIMRAHVPPKLLVGQLSPLRLENYSAFLTTTGSYFTSIRAVADG